MRTSEWMCAICSEQGLTQGPMASSTWSPAISPLLGVFSKGAFRAIWLEWL